MQAHADDYSDTLAVFKSAGENNSFFKSYGYAVFPTIGKGGIELGGAYGKGQVYKQRAYDEFTGANFEGGLMYEASIGGQKFTYSPKK